MPSRRAASDTLSEQSASTRWMYSHSARASEGVSANQLRTSSLTMLEQVYREAPVGPLPSTLFRGQVLQRIDTAFARCAWFFVHPRLQAGHFRISQGRSRWRETQTLQLHYDVSRLPFRGVLYDEVKPLSATLALGLGGLNRDVGIGDLFFFLLQTG